jgi:ubiquinone/menaquinone biosynthesis C-methylase UbiE
VPDPTPGTERPYQIDDEWSRAVFARRTGQVAAFLAPHLRAGMRLLDCGCGPGSITVDLAQAVAPGEAIGIDLREDALAHGRALARERRIANVTFQAASVYQLPYPDGSFDAAFACAVLQHLAAPRAALKEMRRVLKPGGVIGIADGSSTITFRYPTNRSWKSGTGCGRSSASTTRAVHRMRSSCVPSFERQASRGLKRRARWPRKPDRLLARSRRHAQSHGTT